VGFWVSWDVVEFAFPWLLLFGVERNGGARGFGELFCDMFDKRLSKPKLEVQNLHLHGLV
jgi:hypothetical protein